MNNKKPEDLSREDLIKLMEKVEKEYKPTKKEQFKHILRIFLWLLFLTLIHACYYASGK